MRELAAMIRAVAPSEASVLILGESGTGKELVATALHEGSPRGKRPLVTVNCAALTESLLESELFGHEKGSFTGASARRAGKFEVAHEGTIFLDEIGDMSLSTQTKILRVLQDGSFQRVGGNETLKADVRVIAATNRDLPRMIREGQFRADLYYRLNVVHIEMPPLRERPDDIASLVEYFLRRIQHETNRMTPTFSAQAIAALEGYGWPGNVRELENVVRNLVLTSKTDTILASDLRLIGDLQEMDSRRTSGETSVEKVNFEESSTTGSDESPVVIDERVFADVEAALRPLFDKLVEARSRGDRFSTFDVLERAMILHALNAVRGNQLQAAKLLGITRSTLRKRIARYGLRIDTTVR
jgi:transcriptional regulator with GAF, ATPase, and Fis domain